jgi:hypothetical protein
MKLFFFYCIDEFYQKYKMYRFYGKMKSMIR